MTAPTLTRHTVATRSGPLSYLSAGRGPAALFVHGVGTNANLWTGVLEALATERRCLALDLPLHGRSPAADDQDLSLGGLATAIADFCAALDLDQVDLVANDTGGAVAQVLAARHPRLPRTLVLTNCETHDNVPPEALRPTVELARRGELAAIGAQLVANPEQARQDVFGGAFQYPERLTDEAVRDYLEPVFGTERAGRLFERLLTSLDAAELVAAEPRLKELAVPTLLVWGTDDPNFPPRWAHWLRDTLPRVVDLVEVEGGRLFFPAERPADLARPVRRFWREHG
ncbi:Pimeloyl-ACP methyl ester carboxylesterase [Amycolatopsis arida]|uniref:Pimeloyl-ACP methyl ester carboxylesterase n=1 Tax=Amycolatopsis arida TaxID=587909 RepID=A0A1I5XZA3_9PSEU|nr:alpha/beta fold hydrolase [Amycolatopsis arida]TDX97182.1 pimeloyl-ACP methyl ester carboxylesterase [Amycolatopsis arida]SFQ37224.1 Pimeloyl-ACP methyl ester carboxylesterase [Amycolatopsis arida]